MKTIALYFLMAGTALAATTNYVNIENLPMASGANSGDAIVLYHNTGTAFQAQQLPVQNFTASRATNAFTAGYSTNSGTATNAYVFMPYMSFPGLVAAYDADMLNLTNNAPISEVTDLSGTNTLTASSSGVTFASSALNGHGAIFLGSSSCVLTNLGFLTRNVSLNSQFTISVVFKDSGLQAANYYMLSLGTFNSFFIQSMVASPAIEEAIVNGTNGLNLGIPIASVSVIRVMTVTYNGVKWSAWMDGVKVYDGSISANNQPGLPQPGLGTFGNLVIGQLGDISETAWSGYFGKILIWTNALSDSQAGQLNGDLASEYGVANPTLAVDGDSIDAGAFGASGQNWTSFLGANPNFKGFDVICTAKAGRNSLQILTNSVLWAAGTKPGANNWVMGPGDRINDDEQGVPVTTTENNWLYYTWLMHSNNVKVIWHNIPSYAVGDLNGTRATFNSWVAGNAATFADGLVDFSGIPSIWTNGACSNLTLYASDNTHLKGPGYNLSSNAVVSVFQSSIRPAYVVQPPINFANMGISNPSSFGPVNFGGSTTNLQVTDALGNILAGISEYPWGDIALLLGRGGFTEGQHWWVIANQGTANGAQDANLVFWDLTQGSLVSSQPLWLHVDSGNGPEAELPNSGHLNFNANPNSSMEIFNGGFSMPSSTQIEANNGTNGHRIDLAARTLSVTNLIAFSGVASGATNTLVFGATGITNTSPVCVQCYFVVSSGTLMVTNATTGFHVSETMNNQWGVDIILQPGDAITAVSGTITCQGVRGL